MDWSNYYQVGTQFLPKPSAAPANPMDAANNRFTAAVDTNAKDYDNIMQGYQNVRDSPSTASKLGAPQTINPTLLGAPNTYNAERVKYNASPDLTSALASLKGLSETGGLSAAEQGDLRERSLSPLRAVYGNASREMDRNRRLAGGYSPSYNATSAKMARALSSQLSDATTNANAAIAEMVQKGKLAAAPAYGSLALGENNARTGVDTFNAGSTNRANEFNAGAGNDVNRFNAGATNSAREFNANAGNTFALRGTEQDIQRQLESLRGMTSLYGTTPALSSLFGNQALQYAGMNQNAENQNAGRMTDIINNLVRGLR